MTAIKVLQPSQQRALNELRSRFVAMTSHEFRTPLAAILSAEELLRHYGERLPQAERLEVLDSISAGVQRMSRMMDRVLLLGRADAQMLANASDPRADRAKVCAITNSIYERILALPPAAAGDLLRAMAPG